MRILGIDYGTKRVGVAIGDIDTRVAVPLAVLETKNVKLKIQNVVEDVRKLAQEEDAESVIVGQGGHGRMEKKVQEFAAQLRRFVPVEIVDEHFTTVQVERAMKGYGKARKGIDKDSAAAALILQGWMDANI